MTNLNDLSAVHGQSPWLDNLARGALADGTIANWVARGVRGITSNPSIFAAAMRGAEYDDDLRALRSAGSSVEECYWSLVCDDITAAAAVLAPVHEASGGEDGFVSVEVSPRIAHDTAQTIADAQALDDRLGLTNAMIKVPATRAGLPAIRQLTAEGRSINVTLIFSLDRYADVIDAYLSGLEDRDGDLSEIRSVASFFISRVDGAVDPLLAASTDPDAGSLVGTAAVTQAMMAYSIFQDRFSGPRWEALAARGAQVQRPLWASTSTKNPAYPDTLYVDSLIGPNTVNTLPEATLVAFADHGTLARTIDADQKGASDRWDRLAKLVDMGAVVEQLESDGVAAFQSAFEDVLADLTARCEGIATSG